MGARGGGSIVCLDLVGGEGADSDLALSNVLRASVVGAGQDAGQRAGAAEAFASITCMPGTHRHRSRARARRGSQPSARASRVEEQRARTEKTIPLGRYGAAGRIRPRGGVPAVRRRVVHHRRVAAGGWRDDPVGDVRLPACRAETWALPLRSVGRRAGPLRQLCLGLLIPAPTSPGASPTQQRRGRRWFRLDVNRRR